MKTAIVTGAGGTIGRTVITKLISEGANIVAVDVSEEALEKLKNEVSPSIETVPADVRIRDDVDSYVSAAIERFGSIDYFFNNAGIEGQVARIEDVDVENFRLVQDINVLGVLHGLSAVLPHMTRGGSIVNTGSTASLAGAQGMTSYIASKHAVLGLTRTAAIEAKERGIRVNAVCPSAVKGRLMSQIDEQRARLFGESEDQATRVYASPETVADAVWFLFSSLARGVTGQALLVETEIE